jgi:hypothetical protein
MLRAIQKRKNFLKIIQLKIKKILILQNKLLVRILSKIKIKKRQIKLNLQKI